MRSFGKIPLYALLLRLKKLHSHPWPKSLQWAILFTIVRFLPMGLKPNTVKKQLKQSVNILTLAPLKNFSLSKQTK